MIRQKPRVWKLRFLHSKDVPKEFLWLEQHHRVSSLQQLKIYIDRMRDIHHSIKKTPDSIQTLFLFFSEITSASLLLLRSSSQKLLIKICLVPFTNSSCARLSTRNECQYLYIELNKARGR
ncbi:unnamed protein product [Victoria cruziana]